MTLAWTFEPVQRIAGVSPHGLGSAAGFLLGAMLLMREVRRRDLDTRVVERALTWAAVGAIVGARVDYVISQPDGFLNDGVDGLLRIVQVWRGGLALFGGFIGGILFAVPTLRRARVHLPRLLDAAAPGFALGVVIGRVGDLIIADHLGDVIPRGAWYAPFGYRIEPGYELAPGFGPSPATFGPCIDSGQFFAGCTYHQPALYDLVGALVLLLVLLRIRKAARFRAGELVLLWGAWYGLQRFVIDFTRSTVDEHIPVVNLTGTQALGVILFLGCAVTLVRVRRRGHGLQESPDDPPSREGALVRPEPGGDGDGDGAGGDAGDPQSDSGPVSDASSTPSANPRA